MKCLPVHTIAFKSSQIYTFFFYRNTQNLSLPHLCHIPKIPRIQSGLNGTLTYQHKMKSLVLLYKGQSVSLLLEMQQLMILVFDPETADCSFLFIVISLFSYIDCFTFIYRKSSIVFKQKHYIIFCFCHVCMFFFNFRPYDDLFISSKIVFFS